MTCVNRFFKLSDPTARNVAGFELPAGWWSRPYEYAWALALAPVNGRIADMGAGQFYRPLRDGLVEHAYYVYAVDADPRLLDQHFPKNVWPFVASFCERVDEIEDGELDAVYCISVIEDVPDKLAALCEFKRCIAPNGKIFITLDAPYNDDKPCPKYPGVNLDEFIATVEMAGLRFVGEIDRDKTDAIHNDDFNLTVFRCILEHNDQG
jgi:SAM-dependent methyltransferase